MRSLDLIFSTSFFASASFLCSQVRVCCFTSSATQVRISLLPSLCLVWLSNTGSLILMATAPIMPFPHVLRGRSSAPA